MVGEASLGMGKGRKIFEELGVSISDLAGMNAVEQFDAVSKAIANIEQPAARSAIAMSEAKLPMRGQRTAKNKAKK